MTEAGVRNARGAEKSGVAEMDCPAILARRKRCTKPADHPGWHEWVPLDDARPKPAPGFRPRYVLSQATPDVYLFRDANRLAPLMVITRDGFWGIR